MLKSCALALFLLFLAFINNKLLYYGIKNIQNNQALTTHYSLLLSVLCFLFSVFSIGQDYEWDWAKHGGGNGQIYNENKLILSNFNAEMIWDIAIDEDNNYYFLATLSSGDTHVDDNPVPNYYFYHNQTVNTGRDIIIFSFECDGTYRWAKVIGGAFGDTAYHMTLDNNGGLYISAKTPSVPQTGGYPLTCFDDDCLPVYDANNSSMVQEGYKMGFILKYDTNNGDFIWRKDLDGASNLSNRGLAINHLQIDSNNILHTVVGFREGIHLDGVLTVVLDEDADHNVAEYYLLKFDSTTGNLVDTPLQIPLSGVLHDYDTIFRYDEILNRYYITGTQSYSSSQISFNGVDFGEQNYSNTYCFVISFNPDDLDDWWYREIVVSDEGLNVSGVSGIEIDDNSDIYISGSYFDPDYNAYSISFGDHTFSNAPYNGYRPFILKMNPEGEVQWSKIPDSQVSGWGATLDSRTRADDLAINGDEVAMAASVGNATYGDFAMSRPDGHGSDPVLIRFDKQTGEVIGLHDILGYNGEDNYLTAVTADNDGNYVVGGAMRWVLFWDEPNGIDRLYNTGSTSQYTDFFFARLANSACGSGGVSTEVFEQQTLKLYPNPTRGMVHIEAQDLQGYEVYNLLGQRLMSGNVNGNNNGNSNSNNNVNINLQELSQGTYIVKVKTQSGEVMTSKVIKN